MSEDKTTLCQIKIQKNTNNNDLMRKFFKTFSSTLVKTTNANRTVESKIKNQKKPCKRTIFSFI